MASVTSGASAVMARRAERQAQLNEMALAGVSGESEEYSESSMSEEEEPRRYGKVWSWRCSRLQLQRRGKYHLRQ